ncbi:MAG TPA: T9SS type A sorting domain-containing protein [Chitinophagales bacterium]|nr:T9SS type A sorting domain-containing protein [Chitinophagales bacterium]
MKKLNFLFTILLTALTNTSSAQAGNLDSTFSADGKLTTALGSVSDLAYSIALQPDGKIVAAGYSFNGSNYDFALVRYNTNGSLDNSFSSNGKLTTAVGTGTDAAYSVAIQSDGKIVAAGYSAIGTTYDFALVRYNTDGTLDNTFSTDGKVTTAIGLDYDKAFSVAMQTDGEIVAAGYTNNGTDDDFALIRYNTDGTLDNSFGTAGIVTTAIGSGDDDLYSVAIQPDGKIVAAGYSFNGIDNDFALVRYNTNGTLDNGFGTGGKVTTAVGSGDDRAYPVAIQSDGKILVAGFSHNGTDGDFALVRYNADGTLDTSFGTGGQVTTAISSGNDLAYSVAIQPDGKIIAMGATGINFDLDFALVRYDTDGTLDSTFSADGVVTTAIGSEDDQAWSAAIQPDGKIVAAGYSSSGGQYTFALARYLSGLALGVINFSSSESSPLIYPNPIHQTETLEYTLEKNESLTIALYDVNGELIRNFISNEQRAAGEHKETLNIGELTSGNYFLTLSNGSQKMSVKMVKQ